ncbi:MAG TPA: FHA domain-containing protein [Gemmata sp.]|nr:FHA domain-containing protein [Gemmata sp.]
MPTSSNVPAITLSMPQAFALSCKAAGPLRISTRNRATGAEAIHTLDSPYAFLGRSPACSVKLDDLSVSQCHAYVQVFEGSPYCIDLGSRTGVIWEDGTQGRGWTGPRDGMRIGIFDVWVEGPHALPEHDSKDFDSDHDKLDEPPLPPAFIEVHSSGQLHSLDRPITVIGRHPTCDLRLLDQPLAYFQCALVNTPDGMWLIDLLTPRGAILNGRATRLARVRDGDLIEVGCVSLLMRIGSHHTNRAAIAKAPAADPAADAIALISSRVAESMAGAFLPVGEMMKQFQQCFMTMAQMFASMQQEHASVVAEQMRQLHEMAGELRELRADMRRTGSTQSLPAAPSPSPAVDAAETRAVPSVNPHTEPASVPRGPSLRPPVGAEGQALADAHAWFMDRLMGKVPPQPPG